MLLIFSSARGGQVYKTLVRCPLWRGFEEMQEDMDPQVVDIPELEVFHLVLNLIDDYCLCLDYFR